MNSTFLQRVIHFISGTGQDPLFITFMAHCMTFAFILSLFHTTASFLIMSAILLATAAVKEYYFDLHFEANPVQTVQDSTEDFFGYAVGIFVAYVVHFL